LDPQQVCGIEIIELHPVSLDCTVLIVLLP